MTLRDAYTEARLLLKEKNIADADFSARYLLAHVIGKDLSALPLLWEIPLTTPQKKRFFRYVRKRCTGVPLAYLVGYTDFYGRRFVVRPGVLIPRPDTEHLLYAIEELQHNFAHILDIGTGSGILAISLGFLFPHAVIEACDISLWALCLAHHNAQRLKKKIRFHWCDFLTHPPDGVYDLIVSNPPYISPFEMDLIEPSVLRYEPKKALFGGTDGLCFYRAIANYSTEHLSPTGKILVEVDHKWRDVEAIFSQKGMQCSLRYDYQHYPRVLIAEKKL
ncbi:MAG: peptide chain release factor N(5)-glutamine methyltransferase [Brevinematales bacterium]|nr:peptide chain release factor N(5)-glutamine methyltransferase [Brevinematales bacterium]